MGRVTGSIEPGSIGEVMLAGARRDRRLLRVRRGGRSVTLLYKVAEPNEVRRRPAVDRGDDDGRGHDPEPRRTDEGDARVVGDGDAATAARTEQIGKAEASATKARGFGQMFSQVLGMGAAAIPLLRSVIDQTTAQNGAGKGKAAAPEREKTG